MDEAFDCSEIITIYQDQLGPKNVDPMLACPVDPIRLKPIDFFWRDPQFVVAISSWPATSIRTCTNLAFAAGQALKDKKLETKENISRNLIKFDIWPLGAQFCRQQTLLPQSRACG